MRLRLLRKVRITGRDIFGRKSTLCLEPDESSGTNWHWKLRSGRTVIAEPYFVSTEKRRMRLTNGKDEHLEIWEHIGALRYTGLAGVVVSIEDTDSGFPPYHGRAHEIWDAVRNHCEDTGERLPRYNLLSTLQFGYPNQPDGKERYTRMEPASSDQFSIRVILDYTGLGKWDETFRLPNERVLEEILRARTQGWPRWLKPVSKTASLFGWPHDKCIRWKDWNESAETVLHEYAMHRAQDILGAMSLVCHDGTFRANVVSFRSGHLADANLVKKANSALSKTVLSSS